MEMSQTNQMCEITRYDACEITEVEEITMSDGTTRARVIVDASQDSGEDDNDDVTAILCANVGNTTFSVFSSIPKGLTFDTYKAKLLGKHVSIEVVTASVKNLLLGSQYECESVTYIDGAGEEKTTASFTRVFVVGQLGKQSAYDKMRGQLLEGLKSGFYEMAERTRSRVSMSRAEYKAELAKRFGQVAENEGESKSQNNAVPPLSFFERKKAKEAFSMSDDDFAELTDADVVQIRENLAQV